MDPWNDAGETADDGNVGTSWNNRGSRDEGQFVKSSPSASPKFNISGPVDPWAENVPQYTLPGQSIHAIDSKANENDDESGAGEKNDFDPWGGGSVPMTTSLSTDEPSKYLSKHDEPDSTEERGWQPSADEPGHESRDESSSGQEDDEPTQTQAVDDDDPWGSGAQARRIKAEAEAEAAAQRMEIIRLQDEAKGDKSIIEGSEQESGEHAKDKESEEKETENEAVPASTPAPSATGGWRSFFSRSAASAESNVTSRAPAPTSDKVDSDKASANTEGSPRNSTSTAAPRLWQAPSLRTGHARTASNGTQGSGSKLASPATATPSTTQGPGWEVTTKKDAGSSGGFIQNLLGTGQGREGSALSRLTTTLQRPPVISAEDLDDDDNGDIEETGIEWDADKSFDSSSKAKQTKPQTDLLSNDIPQESTVTRIFGRFRGKQNQENMDVGQQNDDLSWLESIGGGGDSSKVAKTGQQNADEEDWLAFVEGKPEKSKNDTKSAQETTNRTRIPNPGQNFSIPNLPKLVPTRVQAGPLSPPPRLNAPPSRSDSMRGLVVNQTQNILNVESSPDPDSAFGSFKDAPSKTPESAASYRDEPDSYDDALLSRGLQERGQTQKKKTNFLGSFSTGGRTVKPYTFDNDDEEDVHENSWSAFKDSPAIGVDQKKNIMHNKMDRPLPPRQNVTPSDYDQKQTLMNSTSPNLSSFQGSPVIQNHPIGILPPPPSINRNANLSSTSSSRASTPIQTAQPTSVAATKPTVKTLSQGKALTNDDLSFFENL